MLKTKIKRNRPRSIPVYFETPATTPANTFLSGSRKNFLRLTFKSWVIYGDWGLRWLPLNHHQLRILRISLQDDYSHTFKWMNNQELILSRPTQTTSPTSKSWCNIHNCIWILPWFSWMMKLIEPMVRFHSFVWSQESLSPLKKTSPEGFHLQKPK